ncbi:MAG: UTP--glucose-1-phosphate uridylyltransferase, partial [Verrucomicrobiia bacterium]
FAINERGTWCELVSGPEALLPRVYYALHVPRWLRMPPEQLSPLRRIELDKFAAACRTRPELNDMVQVLFDRLVPRLKTEEGATDTLEALLERYGFDRIQHEQIRQDLRNGRIGLAQNRLPVNADIRDVEAGDVADATAGLPDTCREAGLEALRQGEVAVVTLAAGIGSRWTQGAGVVKGLHPFCKLAGRHRSFLETHLAKSRRAGRICGTPLPHIITTSYLTHGAIQEWLERAGNFNYPGPLMLSPGRAIGLRLVPMERDLRFLWEETAQQVLDEQQQKVRDSLRNALINWARSMGEGNDYTDNVPSQCLHPVGHWYEVPNLLRNGVLKALLEQRPQLKHLMVHNVDTVGADPDPAVLGLHIQQNACVTFEVIGRRIEDRGGGLARVNGRVRLVEGLAMPREEDEFNLRYYNSNTCWIDIDRLLAVF